MHIRDTLMRLIRFKRWLCGAAYLKKTTHNLTLFRRWLFIGTTFAELMNAIFIIGFSGVFIFNILAGDSSMLELGSYRDFSELAISHWLMFILLGVVQGVSMFIPSIRASKVSGLCLILSAAIWSFLAGTFISSGDGLLVTAPVIYLSWAVGMSLAGYERIITGKKKEKVLDKE